MHMSVPPYRERVLLEPVGSLDNSSGRPPQTASDILSTHVEAILLSGGYLNDRDLHDAMSSHVSEPQRLKELQNISTLNKVVNNAISCYWYGHSVRVFKELEMFLIGRVATYRHMDLIPKKFEEFGMGCLLQNSLVKRQFQFPENIEPTSLLDVSTADIICALFEFRSVTRVQFGEQALEAKFHAFLRARFGRPPFGVDLDFKAIFANVCKSDLDWQGRLAAAKRECSDTYKHILSQAVRTLQNNQGALMNSDQSAQQSPSQKTTIKNGGNAGTVQARIAEPFLRSTGIDISDLRRKFHAMKEHNTQWSPDVYFLDVVDSVWTNNNMRNPCLGLRVMAALQADEWVASITTTEVQACYKCPDVSISEVLLVSRIPNGGRNLITSCVLGLMVYLLSGNQRTVYPGDSTTSAVDLTDEVDLTLEDDDDEDPDTSPDPTHDAAVCEVRQYLNSHLVVDIPQVCMDLIARLLQRLVGNAGFFEFDLDLRNKTSRKGRLNWAHIKRRLEAILDGHVPVVPPAQFERQEQQQQHGETGAGSASQRAVHVVLSPGRCALAKDDYVAIVTMCVIYHRLLHAAETNPDLLATAVSPSPRATVSSAAGVDSADRVSPRVAAIQVIVDSLRLLMADEQKLSVYVKLSQASSPACAVLCVFSTLEKTVNEHFRVPAFECIRLGGSFLQYMDGQLNSDRTDDENAMTGNPLRSAISILVDRLTPALEARAEPKDCAPEDVLTHAETVSSELELPSTETLLAAVSKHLSAVLSSREFAQDSGTDGGISSAAKLSAASQVTQLLSEVEQRVQETEGLWTPASANSSASFLNIASVLMEGNPEVAKRVQRLFALSRQSETELSLVEPASEGEVNKQVMSIELGAQAVLQNTSSGQIPTRFDSLKQCKDSIAQVLMAAFHVPLDTGLRQADRVYQQLKGRGLIHFDESRGSVEIRTSLPSSTGSVLTFASTADATICGSGQDDKLDTLSSAWTENMIELLLQTPLGTSCAEFTLWAEQQSSVATPSIAEFILQHQAVLQSRRPAAVTYFVIPGTDDCVPLPQGIPSVEVSNCLMQALQTKQYSWAASYCMAASMTLIDETAVSSAINAFFLQSYESLGADAMDRLSDLSLQLAYALPRKCRAGQCAVLRLCLNALAAAGKINFDTAQHCVWQAALRTGGAGLHLVRLLVSIGMAASVEFPVFAQCSKEWSTSGVSIISQAIRTPLVPASAESLHIHHMQAVRSITGTVCDGCNMDIDETGSNAGTICSLETAVVEPVGLVNPQKAFVLKLLEEKYHYTQAGLVRPAAESPEGRQLQQAMMLLSATLYSSQVHFVMELIQNADDNTYLPGVTPTIRLELFPHAVVVYNNEQGFSDKNIKAICDVGGSTKANKTGYIGQKGIGFKSVFSISDVPEVHSNGYHIAFRREVSMLEPQWLDPTSESQWPSQYDSSGTYYETCLRLKLDTAALKNLAKLNQDIQAVFNGKLILFLNKLERMVLEDRMRNQVVEHCRTRLSDNWMRISVEASTPASTPSSPLSTSTWSEVFWLVLRHKFSPTVRRMEVVVAETEVAIAFKFIKTGRRFEPPKPPHNPQLATNVETEDEQIRLDFSEGLMPVYAYLPTSTCCFRFMVQGDFVLPTNRESILEQNEWNLGLLNQVPRVFVQAITEMSRWCEAESHALLRGKPSNNAAQSIADFPVLSQLVGSAYCLLIEPTDLLRVLPRRREATRDYIEGVVSNINKELRAVPCLQSRSGAMCAPSQLVAVHHLDFDPATFVSEELLLAATGCQYAMHDIGAYELDNDLVADLGVRIFDTSCIVECLQYLSEHTFDAQKVAKIAHALLGLEALSRFNAVYKQNRDRLRISAGSSLAHSLEPAVRDHLRHLCAWPTSTGTFVTLEHTLLLVQKKRGGAAFTSQQQECLNEFKERLHMIDASLLDAAAACTTQAADLLINFLVDNFKQVRLSGGGAGFGTHSKTGLGTELGAQFSGGVEELTADIVLKRVILPAYKLFAEQQSTAASALDDDLHLASEVLETKETEPGLDRRTAAAFLAFFFHSHWGSRINLYTNSDYSRFVQTIGVVVPTLTASGTVDSLEWGQPSLMVVKGRDLADSGSPAPQTEVHLGLEISESASSALAALHTTTALRQLSWQVLDPLAACFMLGISKVSLNQHKEAYIAAEVNAAFRTAHGQEDMKQWKEFLVRLGLVNFFGVYKTGPLKIEAPQLIRLLNVLLEDAVPVCTNLKSCDEHQANADEEFLPLFLPGAPDEAGRTISSLLRVTQDVYDFLLKIAELITFEVLQVRQTKAASSVVQGSAFLADLDHRCWLPIEVHEKLLDGSCGSAHGHFVCAPRHVISTHAEKSSSVVWYFGAHCAYLPHQMASNPAFRSLFHFHEISSKDSPSAQFLIGYLTWLCEQTEVSVFSSVRFMRWFYEELKTNLLNSENAHASSIMQQRLTALLQDDAALVWIPEQVQLTPQISTAGAGVVDPYHNESFSACYAGKMFPLSRLARRDPSEHLHFDASPVKSLALFYGGTAVMDLFARTQYCKTCQAVEGMFGVRGGNDYCLPFPQLRCTCMHASRLSLENGAVRDSPGAVDLAELLQHHCDDAEQGSPNAFQRVDAIFTTLSVNVWKCFRSETGLRPYSSHHLLSLRKYFSDHALLPLPFSNQFVSAGDQSTSNAMRLALDDLEAFQLFEPELATLQGSIEWLQVFYADSPEVDNDFEEDGGTSAYDMDALKESEQHLLQLPAPEFRTAVGTIPKQTFLAPSNKLALYEFLGIKKFSDHIQESWIKEPSAKQTKTGPAATLVGILNNLLTYAQAHYHHREQKKQHTPHLSQFDALQVYNMVTQLGSAGTRVHSLMQMEVVECRVLQRRVALALGDVRAENVLDATHHREFTTSLAGTRTNTLYVSAQLSAAEVQNLAVSLLTKALRVEVALLEQRHDDFKLEALQRKLALVASRAVNPEILQTILDADDLGPLPPEMIPWEMKPGNRAAVSTVPVSPFELLNALSPGQKAANQPNLAAYERMQHSTNAHRINAAVHRRSLDASFPGSPAFASSAPSLGSPAIQATQSCTADGDSSIRTPPSHQVVHRPAPPVVPTPPSPAPVFRPPLPPGPPPPPTTPILGLYTSHEEEQIAHNQTHGKPSTVQNIASAYTGDGSGARDPSGAAPLPKARTGKKRAWDDTTPSPPTVSIGAADSSAFSGTYVFNSSTTSAPCHSNKKQRGAHSNSLRASPQVDIVFCEPSEEAQCLVQVPVGEQLVAVVEPSKIDRPRSSSEIVAPDAVSKESSLNHSFVSGRLGEELAVRHLRRRLLQQPLMTPGSTPCTAVHWLNEHTESGLPFDIELSFADGSVKHCEVKTHSIANYSPPAVPHQQLPTQQSSLQQLQAPSQWLVSPAEVAQAHVERQGYFCVFVSRRIDYATHQVEELQTRIVGYEHGFMNAIRNKDAKLWVEVSDEHGTYS